MDICIIICMYIMFQLLFYALYSLNNLLLQVLSVLRLNFYLIIHICHEVSAQHLGLVYSI